MKNIYLVIVVFVSSFYCSTVTQVEKEGLQEIKKDSVLITWTHNDSFPCEFDVNIQLQDTTIQFKPQLLYTPGEPDTFGVVYHFPLTVGRYHDDDGFWQVVQIWLEAVKSNGKKSFPSVPVIAKYYSSTKTDSAK